MGKKKGKPLKILPVRNQSGGRQTGKEDRGKTGRREVRHPQPREYEYPPDKAKIATDNILKQAEFFADQWNVNE